MGDVKLAIAILLLALAGCCVDHPAHETRAERIDRLRAASHRSAAHADSVWANSSPTNKETNP
jgi:hypothetical protein